MTIVNAWLLWLRKSGNYLSLFVLKQIIAEYLSKVGKNYLPKKRGRPPSTVSTPTSSHGGTPTEVATGTPPKNSRKRPVLVIFPYGNLLESNIITNINLDVSFFVLTAKYICV